MIHNDYEALDAGIEAERVRMVDLLRGVADRIEGLPVTEAIEPLTLLQPEMERFERGVRLAFGRRVSPTDPPGTPG